MRVNYDLHGMALVPIGRNMHANAAYVNERQRRRGIGKVHTPEVEAHTPLPPWDE